MRFGNPELLLLVLLLPLVVWRSLRPRQRGAAQFSGLTAAAAAPAGWAAWGPGLLLSLRVLALLLVVLALARPQAAGGPEPIHTDGIAIQLVIDNSYSMRLRDYDQDGQPLSRLDAVKQALTRFIAGDDRGLAGRPSDKIGVMTFARHPEIVCPATLDHAAVLEAIGRIQVSQPVGTNIGDALAWALDRLRHEPGRAKVIILLSDGSHNVPDSLPPLEAARLAADLKVRVYTIGAVGRTVEQPKKPSLADVVRQAQGRRPAAEAESVDEPLMRQISERTGGRYFRAADADALVRVYEEIDRLETTPFDKTAHRSYRELFTLPAVPAVVLLLLEQLLAATRFLRVP